VVLEGKDVTLITWGAMLHPSLKAVNQAAERGIEVEVIDLRTLSPLDSATLLKSVEKTGRAVIVHEAPRTGGLGAEIAAQLCEEALLSLEAPIVRVAGYDTPIPLPKTEKYYLPDVDQILGAIEKTAAF